MSFTSIIGPPLMTNLFAAFTAANTPVFFPGAAFMAGAILTIASVVIVFASLKHHPDERFVTSEQRVDEMDSN
jgi:DHA1 family tetracycline resistance protein-like MFS transporter